MIDFRCMGLKRIGGMEANPTQSRLGNLAPNLSSPSWADGQRYSSLVTLVGGNSYKNGGGEEELPNHIIFSIRCPNYHKGKMAKKVYVVFIGRRPGIYYDWEEYRAQVDGYSRAHFRSYSSVAEVSIDWSAFCQRSGSPNVPGDEIPDGRESPVLKGSEHCNENRTSHQLRRSSRPTCSSPSIGVTNAHKDCDEENGNDDAAIIVRFIFGIFILVLFIQLMSLR